MQSSFETKLVSDTGRVFYYHETLRGGYRVRCRSCEDTWTQDSRPEITDPVTGLDHICPRPSDPGERWLSLWERSRDNFEALKQRRKTRTAELGGMHMTHYEIIKAVVDTVYCRLSHISTLKELYDNYMMVDGSELYGPLWDELKRNNLLWAMNLANTEDYAYWLKYTEVIANA